jgi:hypothetical protein
MKRIAGGFLLLPVSLLLIVIGAIAFGLVQDIGTGARLSPRDAERARRLAEAGIAHAAWKLNQLTACSGYTDLPATAIGSDSYKVSVSPTSGSPVTLTATATLAGLPGARVSVSRQVPKTTGNTLTYTVRADSNGGDTYLDAVSPTKNYGGAATLQLQQGASYPLLQFDLSLLPKGSRIVDAQLSLYRENAGSFSLSGRTVNAHRVLEPWEPGTKPGSSGADGATWQTRDGIRIWQAAAPTVESVSALDTPHVHYYLSGYTIAWNLTGLVQGWVDGRYPNYGILLVPTTSFTEAYGSAESTDSARVPKLIVKYVAPCGALNPPQDGISGRVAWWKFDETGGASAGDAVGSHTGSLTGGSWNGSGGVSGGAIGFSSPGKVTVPYAADLSMSGDFSLAAWVNMSDRNGKRPVLYKGTAANEANYAMGTRDGELYFEYFANNAWRTYSTTGLNLKAGTYYHLAATYKDMLRQIKLYVDGNLVGTFTATFGNTPVANTRNLLIGTTPYNENFLGRLDDVQIVASTLDANGVFGTMGGSVRLPVADAYVSSSVPLNANYGAATPLQLSYLPDNRPLLRFDLSNLPTGTVVKRAILSFHIENASILLFFKARLYPLTESWVEGTQNGAISTAGVSWNKRQNSPDLPWSNAGGSFASNSAGILSLPLGATPQRYWEMDITATVQEWVDGVRPNHGLTVLMDIGVDGATISSRESVRQEPRLVITTQ